MASDKFRIVCKAGEEAEITLYDVIDPFWGVTAASIRNALKAAGKVKTIRVRINSPGGSVFEGTAIYNLLKQHGARVIVSVDGLAASMASVVAMAGDEIEMGEGAYLMIHNPVGATYGDSEELRDLADLLDKMTGQLAGIYARRTGRSEEDVRRMMSEETWMTADEAVSEKFADRTIPGLAVAASFDPARFTKIPQSLLNQGVPRMAEPSTPTLPGPATYAELKAAFPRAGAEFLMAQLDASATLEQARSAYQAMLEKRAEDAEAAKAAADKAKADIEAKAAADVKAAADKAKAEAAASIGVTVVPEGGKPADQVSGDPIAEWNAALATMVASGVKRPKAISTLTRERPDLHAAYLAAYNEQHSDARGAGKKS